MCLKSSVFWDTTPCRPVRFNRQFERSFSPSSGWKRESREKTTSGVQKAEQASLLPALRTYILPKHRTARCYIPEDRIFHGHGYENINPISSILFCYLFYFNTSYFTFLFHFSLFYLLLFLLSKVEEKLSFVE